MPIWASYPAVVNYDCDIEYALVADGYSTLAAGVLLSQMKSSLHGECAIIVDLFRGNSDCGVTGMEWSMNAHLRRPLEAVELLAFGEQHPKIQMVTPIIALGTILELGNKSYVLGLTSFEGRQALRLFPRGTIWSSEFYFAGTRKS